jgi:hypothetical protein
MPSRRLPQTDDQRSTALQTCNAKYQNTAAPLRLISAAQFTELGAILSPWRGAREAQSPLLAAQTAATDVVDSTHATCARTNSHFIQVMNLAIERGKLAPSVRAYYELPVSHAEVPVMNTVELALQWAAKLANGEGQRIAAGGLPLAWPAMAEINDDAAALQAAVNAQSTAKDAYDLAQETVAEQRPTVDPFIKDLWDTIEFNLRTEEPSSLRRKAREWGVTYQGEEAEETPPAPPTPPTP